MLQDDNIIRKEGKRWLVGPSPSEPSGLPGAPPRSSLRPIVLVMISYYRSWSTTYLDPLQPFTSEFCSELRRHAYDYILVQKNEQGITRKYFPTGRSEILSLINSLDKRYCGTLITVHGRGMQDIEDWVHWLSQFKKPVVWLDHDNSGPQFDRQRIHRDIYYRACVDEEQLVPLALDQLHAYGHRNIVLPRCGKFFHEYDRWLRTRMEVLERVAARYSPPLTIRDIAQDEELWTHLDGRKDDAMLGYIDSLTEKLRNDNPDATPRSLNALLRDSLFRQVPSLAQIVRDGTATAVIAPNEWSAIQYYHWFHEAGISVPAELSLVSFDKHLTFDHHRLSTVDPRVEELGYRTAHVFMGDIPVKADRRGNMLNEPQFVDRGTLGPPRRGRLRAQSTRIARKSRSRGGGRSGKRRKA
jgi:DNA-binding LacI/PurR family transcriptional regulator